MGRKSIQSWCECRRKRSHPIRFRVRRRAIVQPEAQPHRSEPQTRAQATREIKQRIATGTFVFAEEFPDYRFVKNVAAPEKRRTCDEVFDEFLLGCDLGSQGKTWPS